MTSVFLPLPVWKKVGPPLVLMSTLPGSKVVYPVYLNPHLSVDPLPPWHPPSAVRTFHQSLPSYSKTPLVSLPDVARELGVRSVYVKDESLRLGLPSFKILGASWAVQQLLSRALGMPPSATLLELGPAALARKVRLVTCTDGNWGRGIARMAAYLGVPATVFVPDTMDEGTKDRIRREGIGGSVQVEQAKGDYDVSIREARDEAERKDGGEERLLIMDVGFEGYEDVPRWVVEGYSTMLHEVDEQLIELLPEGQKIDLAVASVGVGSFAQAVTMHFKSRKTGAKVIAVEPTKAACLRSSLKEGRIVSIETEDTIMCGMNCGTVSTASWPVLKDTVDASVIVTDRESHEALQTLRMGGVDAGPCGAAPVAALRRMKDAKFLLKPEMNVLLFCTEGARPYKMENMR